MNDFEKLDFENRLKEQQAEIESLRIRLTEAEETLEAIQNGDVDAVVINTDIGKQIFTLQGADFSYRELVETMNEGAVTMVQDHTVMYCNGRFAEMLKSTGDKITGNSIDEFINNDDLPLFNEIVFKALADKGNVELKLTATDGTVIPVLLSCNAFSEESAGMWLIFTELTDLKRTQHQLELLNDSLEYIVKERTEELRKSNSELKTAEQRFRIVIEGSPITMMEQDLDLRCTWVCNPATGFTEEMLLGRNDADWHKPEDAAKIMTIKRRAIETGNSQLEEVSFFAEGQYWYYELYVEPQRDSNGKIKGIIGYASNITERKRAVEVLEASEAKYRGLFESSIDAILITKPDGSIETANAEACRMFGMTEEELINGGREAVIDLNDPRLKIALDERARTGRFRGELNMKRKDGAIFPVDESNVLFTDSSGSVKTVMILRDITERKQAEEALKERDLNLRLLLDQISSQRHFLEVLIENAPIGIAVIDQEHRYELVNSAYKNIPGTPPMDLIGLTIEEVFPMVEKAGGFKDIEDILVNGTTKRFEAFEAHIDGRDLTYWNVDELPLKDNDGKVEKVLIIAVDVTEIKKSNSALLASKERTQSILEALKETKAQLDLALENGNIGIWERDLKTNSLFWDIQMERMFGLEEGTFEGTYEAFEKYLEEEDVAHTREAIREAVEENVHMDTIYRVRLANGEVKYINAKGSVVQDANGKAVKLAGVCFDITVMKKGTEQVLFKLNDELLRSNKELEQFAFVASHDLQEPLRMVSSFTKLLGQRYKDKLDETGQQFLTFAMGGAERCQLMINDLLKYSRVGTRGKKFSAVDMNGVLENTLHDLSHSIRDKNAVVTFDALPTVTGDEAQLAQLLLNLVGNALKFCDTNPKVHISAKEEPDKYIFTVKDNGIGIEQQYSEKIFLIFQRLFPKEEYGGSGIGLAICKRIVERHGGEICFNSKLGEGTTFYFTIMKGVDQSASSIMSQKTKKSLDEIQTENYSKTSEAENLKLNQELEIYKIELEVQGEELNHAKSSAQDVLKKYNELYDFAPLAYYTISRDGKINELNIGGANILGKERSNLINSRFGFFVSDDTRPIYNQFLENIFKSREKEICEITISTPGNLPKDVYLVGMVTKNEEECYVTAIDITGSNILKR